MCWNSSDGFLNNYGLALILFSFVVKLILLPFSAKSKKRA